jgi:UDP-N-acetylmuramate: L-alanyl-gamma-D-glutamyl-meso-diaminopimelate ligase
LDILKAKRIYFLAICGTAMASLAAMLKSKGYDVYGSDDGVYPPMNTFLAENNIPTYSGFDPAHLQPRPDLVVVGNVISRGNIEIEEILAQHLPYISLPDALREFIIRGHRSIVVTGTHGKTTTSALLAWIFTHAGCDPSFLIGGIPNNFGRGFQVGNGQDVILEGDEYDSAFFDKAAKFLRYLPDIGIINHIEFDHADIYDSLEEIKTAFKRFVNLIPKNGLLVSCHDFELVREISARAFCAVESFGLGDGAEWRAINITADSTSTQFDVYRKGSIFTQVCLPMHGRHNVRNALAAIAVAQHAGIDIETIRAALASFSGVKRRLELKSVAGGVSIYDDFGHHPTAVQETLSGFRMQHPGARIWALFEPRTATTRRSIFQQEFVTSFENADAVLIAPVNRPDKAPPGQVFSPAKLAADLRQQGKIAGHFDSVEGMVDYLKKSVQKDDLIITFSNGPFGDIHRKLIEALTR